MLSVFTEKKKKLSAMFVYTTECGISLARQNVTTTDDIKPEASYLHEIAAKAFVCKHCNLSHGHMYCCALHNRLLWQQILLAH